MTKTEAKNKAQTLIMDQLASIAYGSEYEEFVDAIGDQGKAEEILKQQMDRVAKLFGFGNAWFY